MSDIKEPHHFIEIEKQGDERPMTPCGLPCANGQIFDNGAPLPATSHPHAVTCRVCKMRAEVVAKEYAARDLAEQQAHDKSIADAQLAAAMAIVEASKQKGTT